MKLHELIDFRYGPQGDQILQQRIDAGEDLAETVGPDAETPLHFAARRYRTKAVEILLDGGAEIDARTLTGKTAYAHAKRRGFGEIVNLLEQRNADLDLNSADQFAVAVVRGDLELAKKILIEHPQVIHTGNPEEDRLLADVAGRNETAPVKFLIEAGADLTATALDTGTPLHHAAWFGQPENAKLLIEAGAPLDWFEPTHHASPLGWAVHGSRYSGGADERQEVYRDLVTQLVKAGSSLVYPGQPESGAYIDRLLSDASPTIKPVLLAAIEDRPGHGNSI